MAKLPSGTRRRKDGILEKRFTVNGVRYSVYAVNIKELSEKEQSLREQIKQGGYTQNRNITLKTYFSEWIEQKKLNTKINSIRLYKRQYYNHIDRYLGNKKIKDIERREILKMQGELSKTLSPASVNNIIVILNMILNDAVIDEIIIKNPANRIKALKAEKKATETTHRALTKQEQTDFMAELKDNYYYSYIALMLASGMRSGEVSALTWQDIDYKNNVIHVMRTVTKQENGTMAVGKTAKSDAGVRDIPITATIRKILQENKAKRDIIPFDNSYVFVSPYGNIVANQHINDAIRATIKRLNDAGKQIEPFTSHAMRDTFATRYIEQGGNMQTLQKILGHSSITMTMDIYAHVLPDTKQDEMNRIQICV